MDEVQLVKVMEVEARASDGVSVVVAASSIDRFRKGGHFNFRK